jgi:hypothetical protein
MGVIRDIAIIIVVKKTIMSYGVVAGEHSRDQEQTTKQNLKRGRLKRLGGICGFASAYTFHRRSQGG